MEKKFLAVRQFVKVLKIDFHSSSAVLLARKGGSTALDPVPREFSKKQKKRKRAVNERREAKVDPVKEKLKTENIMAKMESPETKRFIEETRLMLSPGIREVMLPDFAIEALHAEKKTSIKTFKVNPKKILEALKRGRDELQQMTQQQQLASGDNNSSGTASHNGLIELSSEADGSIVNTKNDSKFPRPYVACRAVVEFAQQGYFAEAGECLAAMKESGLPANTATYTALMLAAVKQGEAKLAEQYFDRMIAEGHTPDVKSWSALVFAKCKTRGPDEGLKIIDQLGALGIKPVVQMFNRVLMTFLERREFKKLDELWMRMHSEEIQMDKESFTTMLKYCSKTSRSERAFFLFDEMKSLGIEPDQAAFVSLLRACAEAPHWLPGFEDVMSDALYLIEGAEIEPNAEMYNALIYAFSRARDPVAAEFYFWEMRQKGLKQSEITYNSFLNALASAQLVGARDYGLPGRYSKPPDRTPTEDEQAYLDIGPKRAGELMTAGLWKESNPSENSRQEGQLVDILDDNPLAMESLMEEIHDEARAVNAKFSAYEDAVKQLESRRLPAATVASFKKTEKQQERMDSHLIPNELEDLAGDDETMAGLLREIRIEESKAKSHTLSDESSQLRTLKEIIASSAELGMPLEEEDSPSNFSSSESEIDFLISEIQKEESRHPSLPHLPEAERSAGRLRRKPTRSNSSAERPNKTDMGDMISKAMKIVKTELAKEKTPEFREKFDAVDVTSRSTKEVVVEEIEQVAAEFLGVSNLQISPFQDPFVSERLSHRQKREEQLRSNDQANCLAEFLDGETASPLSQKQSALETVDTEDFEPLPSVSNETIDDKWDLLEFGRPPPADYSKPLRLRQQDNMLKAEQVIADMLLMGVKPSIVTLTSLMSVYGNALQVEDAMRVFREISEKYELEPTPQSYTVLIKMFVRIKDVKAALQTKDDMITKACLTPEGEAYGLLIRTHVHRNKIVEALHLLEEASANGVTVPERHLNFLRKRCRNIGFTHPSIPEDPNAWAHEVKQMRKQKKLSNNNRIASVLANSFTR